VWAPMHGPCVKAVLRVSPRWSFRFTGGPLPKGIDGEVRVPLRVRRRDNALE